MSDDQGPTINVTRGKRTSRNPSSSRPQSSGSAVPGPMQLVSGVAQRAQELWWAGLGVVSVAEEASTQIFEALVEEGKSWEQARRERTKQTAQRVEELTKDGTRAVEAVEEQVRHDVNEVLHRIGVPHRDDVDELRDQIDTLAERMDRLADAIAEQRDET